MSANHLKFQTKRTPEINDDILQTIADYDPLTNQIKNKKREGVDHPGPPIAIWMAQPWAVAMLP